MSHTRIAADGPAPSLSEAGKKPKVVLVAIARKRLVIAYGVMKTRKPFKTA